MTSLADTFADMLREYPALAIFLTLGLGFFIGKIKFGSFSLGSVTAVLLVGVLVGQLDIPLGGPIKSFFFMLFLFSIGYKVGPEFFKSLRGSGLKQVLFAAIMSFVGMVCVVALSLICKFSVGEMVGTFSGSQTVSSVLGLGSESITKMGLDKTALDKELSLIPVCYAVTYIFGVLSIVIILGNFGPKLLGGMEYVKEKNDELAATLSKSNDSGDPAVVSAHLPTAFRAYDVEAPFFNEKRTVRDTERYLRKNGIDAFIDRLRRDGEISVPRYDDVIEKGDRIVICGRREHIVRMEEFIGEEVADEALLDYPLERVNVLVTNKDFIGHTIGDVYRNKFMHGVLICGIHRNGNEVEGDPETEFLKGDTLTIQGRPEKIRKAAPHIGIVDRPSVTSDIMFIGLAIFIGGVFGALNFRFGDAVISFGTSAGALLSGLLFGWLRTKRPSYGNISPGALWIMNNLGLTVFIAVVGMEAAPQFVGAIKSVGIWLPVGGFLASAIPVLFGLWLGKRVFKFNPVITLGCCAGSRTSTPALGAVQNAIDSTLPALSYTVTYATSNILVVVWTMIALSFF